MRIKYRKKLLRITFFRNFAQLKMGKGVLSVNASEPRISNYTPIV